VILQCLILSDAFICIAVDVATGRLSLRDVDDDLSICIPIRGTPLLNMPVIEDALPGL